MNQEPTPNFELPRKLEKLLATLSVYYGKNDQPVLQQLIVNSSYSVIEGCDYDNWNGGMYGHEIHFRVPSPIYYQIIDRLSEVSNNIKEQINKISTVTDEYIYNISIDLDDEPSLENWRQASGALIEGSSGASSIPDDQLDKLWRKGLLRLFISHKANIKDQASKLAEALELYGVTCFVAHEDIKPSKDWQNEIEKALFSMDALLALMTSDFSDSAWTDQEVGVAIGRRIFVIPVRLGATPYGFIGRYQALSGLGKNVGELAKMIFDVLFAQMSLRTRLTESLVTTFECAGSFDHANMLIGHIDKLDSMTPDQIARLEAAPENNRQVRGAWEVERRLPPLVKRLRKGNM